MITFRPLLPLACLGALMAPLWGQRLPDAGQRLPEEGQQGREDPPVELPSEQAPASRAEDQAQLDELGDADLYFEAYYRRFFQFDAEGARDAFELLAERRTPTYRRLALLHLLELHRDAMRYDAMLEVLRRIRQDRGSELPGVVRTEIRSWMREIERHDEELARDLREFERSLEQAPSEDELERARRRLSLARIHAGGRSRHMLHFGSPFFSFALRQYAGDAAVGQARTRHSDEVRDLERRIGELRAKPPQDGAPEAAEYAAELERLEARLEMHRQAVRGLPPAPPHTRGSRAGAWHRAMVHRLQQKRGLREREGRSAIVRLYDERIQRHLLELARIGLRELRDANEEHRARLLQTIGRQLDATEQRLRGGAHPELAAALAELRPAFEELLRRADWTAVEARLDELVEKHGSLLEQVLLDF